MTYFGTTPPRHWWDSASPAIVRFRSSLSRLSLAERLPLTHFDAFKDVSVIERQLPDCLLLVERPSIRVL